MRRKTAETYREVIEHFADTPLLGLTAMRDRTDGQDIAELFGEPVTNIPLEEAIIRGLLTPFEYRVVSDGLNAEVIRRLTAGLKEGERYTLADLNNSLFIETRDEEIVRRVEENAVSRKTLVFCRNIKHADRIAILFGRKAQAYHSGSSRGVNKEILRAFRAGRTQYLVVVNKANEGVDIPDAEVVVFLRTTESRVVFFEQLGRTLRKLPGKKKALVLDFVGNLERIAMLQEIIKRIPQGDGNSIRGSNEFKEEVSISGENFEFNFSETVVEVINLVAHLKRDFYKSWREASEATLALGCKNQTQYAKLYKKDLRLPARPSDMYLDFPGWATFLAKKYATMPEASQATARLNITTTVAYEERYKEDPRLPSDPDKYYSNFPGWIEFFGRERKKFHGTWRKASASAKRLNISSQRHYKEGAYKTDPRLPGNPQTYYDDFPGWDKFLGKK